MKFIIKLTLDTNSTASATDRVKAHGCYRYAANKGRTWDHAAFVCLPSEAKVFKGTASAHLWLRRNGMLNQTMWSSPTLGLSGLTPRDPFTNWELVPLPA
jgi:hypothetical protein